MMADPANGRAPTPLQIETVEADAWADLQRSLPSEFRARLGIDVRLRDNVTLLVARNTRELILNRVIGLGLSDPLSESELDAVIAEYASAGVARFMIQWSPAGQPANAEDWFAARGFTLLSKITKLYRLIDDAEPAFVLPPELRIDEIGPRDGERFEEIVAAPLGVPEGLGPGIRSTLGTPGWKYYLAYAGERPVAGAALYARDGRGWCGLGATLPAERGRGAQTALLRRRIADARAQGCAWVAADTLVTKAPSQSRRNMERVGFCAMYERPNYVLEL